MLGDLLRRPDEDPTLPGSQNSLSGASISGRGYALLRK